VGHGGELRRAPPDTPAYSLSHLGASARPKRDARDTFRKSNPYRDDAGPRAHGCSSVPWDPSDAVPGRGTSAGTPGWTPKSSLGYCTHEPSYLGPVSHSSPALMLSVFTAFHTSWTERRTRSKQPSTSRNRQQVIDGRRRSGLRPGCVNVGALAAERSNGALARTSAGRVARSRSEAV